MSTYTHRYIEVCREAIDGATWRVDELPPAERHQGEVYKINDYNRPEDVAPYYKSDGVQWVPLDKVEKKWVPIKWYSFLPKNRVIDNEDPYYKPKYIVAKDENGDEIYLKENILWANNGGFVRDDYISSRSWNQSAVAGRGLPSDISDEVKNDIDSDYAYDKTWVTLAEWETIYEEAEKEFRRKVEKYFEGEKNDEINRKLEHIIKLIKNPNAKAPRKKEKGNYYDYEDSLDYLFEEDIWKLFNIQAEIEKTEFILQEFEDWFSHEDVRIIYYLA